MPPATWTSHRLAPVLSGSVRWVQVWPSNATFTPSGETAGAAACAGGPIVAQPPASAGRPTAEARRAMRDARIMETAPSRPVKRFAGPGLRGEATRVEDQGREGPRKVQRS